MAKIVLEIRVEIDAPTVSAAVAEFLGQPLRYLPAGATVIGMPQGGLARVPLVAGEISNRERAACLGYRVLSGDPEPESWYVERGGDRDGKRHLSENAAWRAATRHAMANWPLNWEALG